MRVREGTVRRAYSPWWRRGGQWWMFVLACAAVGPVAVMGWGWPVSMGVVIAADIVGAAIDALVTRRVRARYARPDRMPWIWPPERGGIVAPRL